MEKAAGVVVVESLLVVVLLIIVRPLHVADSIESADHTCSGCTAYQSDCSSCYPGRCCSPYHYCGFGLGYCTACYCWRNNYRYECDVCYCKGNCGFSGENQQYSYPNATHASVPDLGDDNSIQLIVATFDDRNLNNITTHVSDNSGSTAATATTSAWPLHLYGSAAICEPSSSSTTNTTTATVSTRNVIVLGQCLQVTNPENGRHATVKITDKKRCSNGTSLVLDRDVFRHLDTSDERINVRSNLSITFKHVRCIHD